MRALNVTSVRTETHIPWTLAAGVEAVDGVVKSEGYFQRVLLLILFSVCHVLLHHFKELIDIYFPCNNTHFILAAWE